MKKLLLALFIGGTLANTTAQEMPAPSPAATTIQRVGLTDVEITYSRPSVKGRDIFGALVPYGEVWRLGANASTKVKFSTDVNVNGKDIKAGTYSFYAIPNKDSWTLMLNNDLTLWGSDGYDAGKDAVRMEATPKTSNEKTESMRISVENVTAKGADIVIAWDNIMVALPIAVESDGQVAKNMETALNNAYRAHRNAAEYYADKGEFEKAFKQIDMAIEMNSTSWYTQWIKAEIYAKSGDMKKAIKQGEAAIKMGDEYYASRNREFTYKPGLVEDLEKWKASK